MLPGRKPPCVRACVRDIPLPRVALAARIDVIRSHRLGQKGEEYRDEIAAKIVKWQQPPPAKQKKPLKAPDDVPKKKRGGKRCVCCPCVCMYMNVAPVLYRCPRGHSPVCWGSCFPAW